MILDEYNEFADANAGSGDLTAGSLIIGDVIPLKKAAGNFPADGRPIYVVIQVAERFITAGTAGTVQFFLVSDENAALNDNDTGDPVLAECTEHARTISLTTDDATALDVGVAAGTASYVANQVGQVIMCAPLPLSSSYEKYLGIIRTIGTTTITGGKIDAFLTDEPTRWRAYADAIA